MFVTSRAERSPLEHVRNSDMLLIERVLQIQKGTKPMKTKTKTSSNFEAAVASARSNGIYSIDAGNGYTPEEKTRALPAFEKGNHFILGRLNRAHSEGRIPTLTK